MVSVSEKAKEKIVELRQKEGLTDNYCHSRGRSGGWLLWSDVRLTVWHCPTTVWPPCL